MYSKHFVVIGAGEYPNARLRKAMKEVEKEVQEGNINYIGLSPDDFEKAFDDLQEQAKTDKRLQTLGEAAKEYLESKKSR